MSDCKCRRCQNQWSMLMSLCATCGNKRCPRAEWHGYECSGSNELGQSGKMTLAQAAAVLVEHQAWRRGGEGPQLHPKTIGEALDIGIEELQQLLYAYEQLAP